jgi:hypothetical protein
MSKEEVKRKSKLIKEKIQEELEDPEKTPEYEPPPIPGETPPDNLASERDHPNPNPK